MSNHEEHHHETSKRVYFGIPIAFAFTFWFIIFLCMKTCDGPKQACCKDGEVCTKECKAKCEAEDKTDCAHKEGEVKEEQKEEAAAVTEEKKEDATEKKVEKPMEEKPATEEKK